MFIKLTNFFKDKKVLILGFGLEGKSTLKILEKIPCEIGISDINLEVTDEIKKYKLFSGENYLSAIDEFDIVMKAPGVVLLDKLSLTQKKKITSQTDLLLQFCKNTIIGITGTKGKSTTSSLIHHILSRINIKSILIGNIGIPPLEKINEFTQDIVIVLEMSCHQLEYVKASPNIAVLLNIYEEHLDHYIDFEAYKSAKLNICKFQKKDDFLIYNSEIELDSNAEKIGVSFDNFLNLGISADEIKTNLKGRHNLYNIVIAVLVCQRLGCGKDDVLRALQDFKNLPHRLESLGFINGAEYINDSISTLPLATISAVESFPRTDTLIIGGMDRGINYNVLIDYINKSNLKNLIALPNTGTEIAKKISNKNINIYLVDSMEEAVKKAKKVTEIRCILSPAAASYGFYKNFEERGNHFKNLLFT